VKKAMIGLFLFISFILVSCVSVPGTNDKNQTLVIGEISHEAHHPTNMSINGTNRIGIEITIQDIASGKTYTMRSLNKGLFYSRNMSGGRYRIKKLLYTTSNGASHWHDDPPGSGFEIVEGVVNNLGVINWYANWNTNIFAITYNLEYDQVRNDFQQGNRSSNWNGKQWINVSVR